MSAKELRGALPAPSGARRRDERLFMGASASLHAPGVTFSPRTPAVCAANRRRREGSSHEYKPSALPTVHAEAAGPGLRDARGASRRCRLEHAWDDDALLGIFLKGSGTGELLRPVGWMLGLGVLLSGAALVSQRRRGLTP